MSLTAGKGRAGQPRPLVEMYDALRADPGTG
jgi:hypothetical protein